MRFVIKSVRTYQPTPEMVVEAPEFMSVDYLKRRIMKAKLLRGEVSPRGARACVCTLCVCVRRRWQGGKEGGLPRREATSAAAPWRSSCCTGRSRVPWSPVRWLTPLCPLHRSAVPQPLSIHPQEEDRRGRRGGGHGRRRHARPDRCAPSTWLPALAPALALALAFNPLAPASGPTPHLTPCTRPPPFRRRRCVSVRPRV